MLRLFVSHRRRHSDLDSYPKLGGSVGTLKQNDYDDVIKWKHFPRNWPFVRRIHRSPVNSPHKGQWRGALMFSLIYVWINDWVNNREAGDLRRYRAHYDVIVMLWGELFRCVMGPVVDPAMSLIKFCVQLKCGFLATDKATNERIWSSRLEDI